MNKRTCIIVDCKFRLLHCPEPDCQSTCKTSQELASHLDDSHGHVYINPDALTNPEGLPLPLSWTFLMSISGERYYKLRVELVEAGCSAYVVELENPGRSVPLQYRISLSGNGRAFAFTGFAHSYEAPSKPTENGDCLFVRSQMIAYLSGAKNTLQFRCGS